MDTNSPQPALDGALYSLTASIDALNLAEQKSSTKPTKSVFGSAGALLMKIRGSMVTEQDYVKLGLFCADVCHTLDQGLDGRGTDELSGSLVGAIESLTSTLAAIQNQLAGHDKGNSVSSPFHAKSDKDQIAAWGQDLDRILHIFTVELSINNRMMLLDIRRDVHAGQGSTDRQIQSTQISIHAGEPPPPRPRACFGRAELIKKIIDLADTFAPIALIGPGGIGKTSVALTVLHHDRIKGRFGGNRRFIRCDKFPASCASFLRRLSKVIGAGVENPKDLARLRSFLSSEEMFIVLDNAESILDPQGTDGKEIYDVVEELSQFDNICLTITSRITTVPPDCETLDVPPLSMEAARDTFYRIYKHGGRSDPVNDILRQLDYHPLSVTLLATVAHQNRWDNGRLAREWESRQTGVLQTGHSNSLAAAIELSLSSPMFKELDPDARELLGVVAFFPQGVDENNGNWLFPSIPNTSAIFDKFCTLSLAYRSSGFVTMLAPLRDYLRPPDPTQSPLLCTTKDLYFTRLSVIIDPHTSSFRDSRWIKSEDMNAEYLLDVFLSIDTNLEDAWDACAGFIRHLYWHKPRQIMLSSKIERLPDDHRSKPGYLLELSELFRSMGNRAEQKLLLLRILVLSRKEGNDYWVAKALRELSDANRVLGLFEEGIQQAKEALEIMERVGGTTDRAECLNALGCLFWSNKELDAAQDAASGAIILWEKGQEFQICQSHRLLGKIQSSKGERKKAIHHFEVALGIASRFEWHDQMFWIRHSMAWLFYYEDKLDDAQAHITQAKSHAVDDKYRLGRVMEMQARIWYRQNRLEDAISETLDAKEIYEKLGAATGLGRVRDDLQFFERAMESRAVSVESDLSAPQHPDE